jgi:hypothetical protein
LLEIAKNLIIKQVPDENFAWRKHPKKA